MIRRRMIHRQREADVVQVVDAPEPLEKRHAHDQPRRQQRKHNADQSPPRSAGLSVGRMFV